MLVGRLEVARTASHHSATTPATCGVAMLVPFSERKPPPRLAERMSTPGALICGKVLEKGATLKPCSVRAKAPTETTPSAAAGRDTAISKSLFSSRRLSLPAAAHRMVPWSNAVRARTISMSASNTRRLPR